MKRAMLLVVLFLVLGLVSSASAQLPAGWSQTDIGGPSPAGNASYDQVTGTWTVTSDGADIWDTWDSFHFVFRSLKGDGMVTARVVSIAGASPHEWAKAGVMIRETLNANSRHAMMTMTPSGTQNHAAQFLWRPTTGGFSDQSSGGSMNLPYWVRIQRTGNTFRGYISPNGNTWTPQGTAQTISMSQNVYIGLAAVSRVAGQLNTDKFDNVAIQGELIEPVPAKAITYQGRLLDGDLAADGLYDLQFSLYDAPTGGSQTGQTIAIEDMDVIEGYFTVDLDFGEGVFDGNPRWLQIAVRPGAGTGSLTILDPRQRIAPTPYALYAFSGAGGGGGGVTAPLVLSGSVAGPGAIIKGTNTGSGIGLYGQGETAGVYGENSSRGTVGLLGGVDSGVVGENRTSLNFGVLGGPTYGVYGFGASGLAGLFDGMVQITGGSPGAGKVLTSDAAGLASWQAAPGGDGHSLDAADGSPTDVVRVDNDGILFLPRKFWIGGGDCMVESDGLTTWIHGYIGLGGLFADAFTIDSAGVAMTSPTIHVDLDVHGPANLNRGVTSGVALRVNDAEALWFDGTQFSWGFGGQSNYFADAVSIGTPSPSGFMLAVNGSAAKLGGGSWSAFSDARLKDIHCDYRIGLTEVAQLNPVRYRYSAGNQMNLPTDKQYVGVVAQEVQRVIPEAVEENSNGYLMVNNDPIIWAMVNAIKELKAENDALKQRLEFLERKADQTQSAITKEVQP